MVLCLGEPPGGFCDVGCCCCCCFPHWMFFIHFWYSFCCCSSFIFVLHLLLLFFIHCFSTSSLTLPWTIAGFLRPFYTFSPAHRRVIRDNFILTFPGSSFTVLPRALRFWVGIFLPAGVFYLTLLHRHFPAFIKASLGVGSSSLKFAGLHTDPRNTDPAHLFVWFTVIHNLHIQKNSFLNSTIYYHELLTCGKKFSLYAAYLFRTLFACSKYM